jgi:C-terminal processing protease CtpA/Prc
LSPEFILNKFYPKFDYKDLNKVYLANFEKNKEVHIKVTRFSEYGERYKLFVIPKNSFEESFNLENYGLNIVEKENKIIVDNLKWNGFAKKSGFELDDLISEIKVENLNRPSKNFVYPIALLFFLIFGYFNKRRENN